MKARRLSLTAAGLMAMVAAGCSTETSTSADLVPMTVSLSASTSAELSAAGDGLAAVLMAGPVRPSEIDSVIVTVLQVLVLPDSVLQRCHPPEGDSAHGFRPGPGPRADGRDRPAGPFGPGGPGDRDDCRPERGPDGRGPGDDRPHPPCPDSLMPPDSGWGSRPSHWYALDVVGDGHLDLKHLPADGLTLASGAVPAGEYKGARLVIRDATIWFNTTLTAGATTFKPDTGYAVTLPHRPGGPMNIMTRTGFTVPDGGGDVTMLFNPDAVISRAAVTASGQVFISPVLQPHWPH